MGLHTSDILHLEARPCPPQPPSRPILSQIHFQPFGHRDRSILDGLMRKQACFHCPPTSMYEKHTRGVRLVVAADDFLRAEVAAMRAQERKLELEAVHTLGANFLSTFLRDKVMRYLAL
eukprot:scaffold52144_cov33-Tisochrysis_lutea.AAC.3